jgi:2-oxoglutarate ferredoxin oxidoreductase subunit alpha
MNHQVMIDLREAKIQKIADFIPEQEIEGEPTGDLLVVSWGGTQGAVMEAVDALRESGKKISHAHFNYIMPLPRNTSEVLKGFRKIIVCELNNGQFVNYLRMTNPQHQYLQYNKVQGLPFMVTELVARFNEIFEEETL